jgi:uncharacterized protein
MSTTTASGGSAATLASNWSASLTVATTSMPWPAGALLYGMAPLRALSQGWPNVVTSFLPTLGLMVVFHNVAEEAGWTGFLFARLQERHRPATAALFAFLPFWAWHVLSFVHDEGALSGGLTLAAFLALPLLASRIITGWLYNVSGASALIAGLFHATFNATVNPYGFAVSVLGLPQGEMVYVVGGIVVLAAAAVAMATRGRLGHVQRRVVSQ